MRVEGNHFNNGLRTKQFLVEGKCNTHTHTHPFMTTLSLYIKSSLIFIIYIFVWILVYCHNIYFGYLLFQLDWFLIDPIESSASVSTKQYAKPYDLSLFFHLFYFILLTCN